MARDQCRVVDGCAPAVRRRGAPSVVGQCRKQESNKIVSRRQLCGVEIGFVEKKNCRMIIKHRWPRVAISIIFLMKHKYCA